MKALDVATSYMEKHTSTPPMNRNGDANSAHERERVEERIVENGGRYVCKTLAAKGVRKKVVRTDPDLWYDDRAE